MLYGLLSDDIKNSSLLKNHTEVELNTDISSFDKAVLLRSHNSDEYVFCAANKIKNEDYSFITITSINIDIDDFKKLLTA